MEWLSHSQKKHCELCKTSFRFTKLYAADMPKTLPFHIFISHMAKYLFRNIMVWMRGALVASVWLGWLPYLMRSVWSFLFWISDEGLGEGTALFRRTNAVISRGVADSLTATYGTAVCSAVCPSSPLFAATTTVATVGGVMDGLTLGSMRLVKSLYNFNLTSTDPLHWTILRLIFGSGDTVDGSESDISNATASIVEKVISSRIQPSLLSEVKLLRNLTRHPSINRSVIAILEGQIITILVIVCFILIILVRDYVVQQQPDMIRAAFPPAENVVQQPLADVPEAAVPEIHRGWAEPDHWPGEDAGGEEAQGTGDQAQPVDEREDTTATGPSTTFVPVLSHVEFGDSASGAPASPGTEQPRQDKNAHDSTAVHEYLAIYRAADGDLDKILKIVREMNMEEKLDYWIQLTKLKRERDKRGKDSAAAAATADWVDSQTDLSAFAQAGSSSTSHFDEQLDWAHEEDVSSDRKGKGKQRDDEVSDSDDTPFLAGSPLRPRANTDGPKVNNTFNPLANNNWSFADLPDNPPPTSTAFTWEDSMASDRPAVLSANTGATPSNARAESRARSASSERESEMEDPLTPDSEHGSYAPVGEAPAAPAAPPPPPPAPQLHQAGGILDLVADFMWRDIVNIDPAELAAVDLDDFADDGDFDDDGQDDAADDLEQDREVVEAAVAAGLDPEAIEDAEDLEGILELLGMRGPVAGLFQNAIFCAFLVSITIFVGIFIPYNIGRISVWTIANPIRPARMLFSLSKFIQDCAVIMFGILASIGSLFLQAISILLNLRSFTAYLSSMTARSYGMAVTASNRIGASFVTDLPLISTTEIRNFSAISHHALLSIKGNIALTFSTAGHLLMFAFERGTHSDKSSEAAAVTLNATVAVWDMLKQVPGVMVNPSAWVVDLSTPEKGVLVDAALAHWNGGDRFWAIASGYVALTLMAGVYLRRGTPFSTSQTGQEWEASIIDGLNQASGVMKVILIIGIEMLVFPLYCGMLLDIALLPLFEDASIGSRLLFTMNYPVTSVFVHWFVGTGYMFHFALFVSMCRKIMRKGVLYFIRDPDDPEFHPVRDVLERSVTTQLRKIMFSALVYGALVIVCLGGVVWGLASALPGVLPVHYSSNEPVLEFPIDLLFYNFLMPLAVKFFKPSDSLHMMYTWWFRKCARALRITWFLFGERRVDEEGHLKLRPDSDYRDSPWWLTLFLEVDSGGEVVPKTFRDTFEGGTAKPTSSIPADEMMTLHVRKLHLVKSGQLVPDGRFVRAPASDQVKIPKGQTVFLDVDEGNTRKDGRDIDIYSTNQYQLVYVPPHFRARVFLFILLIWIFAAVTGVAMTIVPLESGRMLFKLVIPGHIRTNDIYAFSIGVYVWSTVVYALFHANSSYQSAKEWLSASIASAYSRESVRRISAMIVRSARVAYAYFFLFVAFPLMVATLMELYAIIPLHEFMYSGLISSESATTPQSDQAAELNPRHTIRVVQGWTIGLLYLKLSSRVIVTWFDHTRLAAAVRAVLRRGWLDPDLAVLTRAFVVPGLALWMTAVAAPLLFARFFISHGLADSILEASGTKLASEIPGEQLYNAYFVLIYRLSFPFAALAVVSCFTLWSMVGVLRSCRARIRDEAYLIGERLHNFGVVNGPPKTRGTWRTGGPRL